MNRAGMTTCKKGETSLGIWTGAAVLWLAVCLAAEATAQLGLLSVKGRLVSPVELGHSYTALVVGQAFFLIFLWPLFERRSGGRPFIAACADIAARLLALILLALPLVLIARHTSDISAGDIVRSQGLLLLLGVAVAAAIRLPGSVSWYYPAAALLAGVVPLAAYFLREGGRVSAAWAGVISPLWAAGGLAEGTEVFAPLIVFAALAALALAALAFLPSRQS